MNKILKVSFVLNVALMGALIFALLKGQRASQSRSQVVQSQPPTSVPPAATREISSRPEPKPFRWSQLDSDNYHIYVKNLRAIGCPEPTLRAIVTADVDAAYLNRSRALEQKLTDLASRPWSVRLAAYSSEQALEAELRGLPGQESAEIADFLGLHLGPSLTADAVPAPAQALHNEDQPSSAPASGHRPRPSAPISLPLALQDVPVIGMSSQQIQVINDVRQNFLDEIGGLNQDPNDPAYLANWQNAQPKADNLLKAMLGATAFENYQLAAADNTSPTAASAPTAATGPVPDATHPPTAVEVLDRLERASTTQ
jgi:hypothetical protein